jgi:hypothetical protein
MSDLAPPPLALPLDKLLETRARLVAHKHCSGVLKSRCVVGRDGQYRHSSRCNELTSDILRLVTSTVSAIEKGKP